MVGAMLGLQSAHVCASFRDIFDSKSLCPWSVRAHPLTPKLNDMVVSMGGVDPFRVRTYFHWH